MPHYETAGMGLVGAAAPRARVGETDKLAPTTPLMHVYRQLEKAEALAERTEALVNKLIGSIPKATDGPCEPCSYGELFALADRANYVERRINEAQEALTRLFETL